MNNPVRKRGDFKYRLCLSRGAMSVHRGKSVRRARCRARACRATKSPSTVRASLQK
ncbi:MAG: hypothetical protein LBG31_06100 [Prevotellaceae bacterium]|nr:hypothetical protein [Prevotellaceae bacterium]